MSRKIYLTLILIIVLLVAAVATFYLLRSKESFVLTVGVNVGDVFTYQMVGFAELYEDWDLALDSSILDTFADLNNAKYCRVEITNVDVPNVSYTITWEFKNGTTQNANGMVNIQDGTYRGYYWNIYASGLTQGSISRPSDSEEPIIIETIMESYTSGDREINFIQRLGQSYDTNDASFSTQCYVYHYIYFDKQIGILTFFRSMEIYTSPPVIVTVEYKLIDSNIAQIP